MINSRNINYDIGSDRPPPQDRANAAGFRGKVAQTVAINPALLVHVGAQRLNIGLARVRVEVPMFGRDVADAHLCTVLQPSP
jgi:hypothetical protein